MSTRTITATVTAAGAGSFVIPQDVTSITVEAWGGGAGGANSGSGGANGGRGGSGGAYIAATYAVTAGDKIYWNVAAAQTTDSADGNVSWFNKNTNSNNTGAYKAGGGFAGQNNTAGGAPTAGTGGTDVISFSGGVSISPGAIRGSGGGGGAGSKAAGGRGDATTAPNGGAGGSPDGGDGGDGGQTANSPGSSGQAPGGGGGGAGVSTTGTSGAGGGTGARGQIRYTYDVQIRVCHSYWIH